MFKVSPWIFRMKTRTSFCFLGNDWEAGEREIHPALCYFLGLPLVNWKRYLPSVNLPPSTCLARMPYTCSASAGTHRSIWQLAYCLIPGWVGNTGHLGSVFKWCDRSCGEPENDRLSLPLLPVGKKSEGNRRELFSDTQQLWLDCSVKEHTTHWLSLLWAGAIEGKPWFFFKMLVNCSRQNYGH